MPRYGTLTSAQIFTNWMGFKAKLCNLFLTNTVETSPATPVASRLNMELPRIHRQMERLKLYHNSIHNNSAIGRNKYLLFSKTTLTRHSHHLNVVSFQARSDSFKHSYFSFDHRVMEYVTRWYSHSASWKVFMQSEATLVLWLIIASCDYFTERSFYVDWGWESELLLCSLCFIPLYRLCMCVICISGIG